MKKFFALALLMVAAVVTGCKEKEPAATPAPAATEAPATTEPAAEPAAN